MGAVGAAADDNLSRPATSRTRDVAETLDVAFLDAPPARRSYARKNSRAASFHVRSSSPEKTSTVASPPSAATGPAIRGWSA